MMRRAVFSGEFFFVNKKSVLTVHIGSFDIGLSILPDEMRLVVTVVAGIVLGLHIIYIHLLDGDYFESSFGFDETSKNLNAASLMDGSDFGRKSRWPKPSR